MKIRAKKLLTPGGWLPDRTVRIERGVVVEVGQGADADRTCDLLTPGLFDLHNHGGEGIDFRSGTAAGLAPLLTKMLREGVTDMLLTVSTSPVDVIRHGLAMAREAMRLQQEGALGGTRVYGVHMEGPFLNPDRPGAMDPKQMLAPSPGAFRDAFGEYMDVIREVTLAPEVPGALELAAYLAGEGICVQAGHTDATYEQAEAAFASGVTSLCHTFNACRPIHHRDPAVVTAALLNRGVYSEAICDLVHLHPGAILLIYRMKGAGRAVIVSDSTMLHGMPDGEYGGRVVRGGVVRTTDGALSGGRAYLGEAVRNAVSIGIPEADAFLMASETPARRVGADKLGAIRPGMAAHLAAFDEGLACRFTVIGENVYE